MTGSDTPATDTTRPPDTTRSSRWIHLAFAVVAWVPLLTTAPGRIAADTRPQLYLDPGQFIERARSIWDPFVHMGTVTHQNLGLIAPMGWWYWLVDVTGTPTWVGQRLWLGAIFFAAACGVLHLGRTLRWPLPGTAASAAIYAFSPYVLQYATRTSVLLLPFAGLPWLLSYTIRAARDGGWRAPAWFAVVVFLVGSVNATSLVLVGLGPVLWLVHAVATRQASPRRAAAAAARIGVLSLGVSLWWIVGLVVQSRHGLPVLTYTETLDQVSVTSSATEALRGLGYWVFYGREVLDPNVAPAVAYTQNPALLALTYAIPLVAIAAAMSVRFVHRGYFALLVVVGTMVAVGSFPVGDPSPGGSLFRELAKTTAGLALRSSTRAVPLVILGLAVFIGRGVDALPGRPAVRWRAATVVGLAALVSLPALTTGGFVDRNFDRASALPDHWNEVAAYLDAQPSDGSVLEIPGIQFATYRWGTTYEPVTPGLIDRPVIAREQLPYGSTPSADLLIALDRRLQEGVVEPTALAPIARLMGAEWILMRNDLAFERYVSPRPRRLWRDLDPLPPGIRQEASFGAPVRNAPDRRLPLLDEEFLGLTSDAPDPAPVELLQVEDPLDRLRVSPTRPLTILAGDGEGVVDTAAAGRLDVAGPLLYAQTLLDEPDALAQALVDARRVIITDTNRKRARRWRSVRWSTGRTERADEPRAASDLGDGDLAVFDNLDPDGQTTVVQLGATVDATVYGGPFTLDPDVRPALAVDGRHDTAWVVGPFADARGEKITVRPIRSVVADEVSITQRAGANTITSIDVTVNGGEARRVALDHRSLERPGQPIAIEAAHIDEFGVRIVETSTDAARGAPVGITEIDIGGTIVEEVVRLPVSFVDHVGTVGADTPISYVLTRLRSDPAEPVRGDEERALNRRIRVPDARPFAISGSARLSGRATDLLLDEVLGSTGPSVATSTSLPGDLTSRGRAALDGDDSTAWQPAFLDLGGAWLDVRTTQPVTIDELDMTLVDDGDHSIPTRVELAVDGRSQIVDLPPPTADPADGTRRVRVPVESVAGSSIRLTVLEAEHRLTTDYYSRAPIATPFGLAELRLPGVELPTMPVELDTGCREDLVEIDGEPLTIRVTGSAADAAAGRPLAVEGCGAASLDAGDHDLQATAGETTGLDLDRLVLESADTGGQTPADRPELTQVEHPSSTRYEAVLGQGDDTWVVLAESHEPGWALSVDGVDQGPPILIDAGFNGWRVPASADARNVSVEWKPQRAVDRALVLSGLFVVVALTLALGAGRRPLEASPSPLASRFRWPRSFAGASARVMISAAGAAALLGGMTLGLPGAALGVGAVMASRAHPRGLMMVAVASVVAWSLASAWIVGHQVLRPRPHDFEWADVLVTPHRLASAALVLLAVVVMFDVRREADDR